MTKFSLTILKVLSDHDVDTSLKALSINQILFILEENQRKSYSTMYRHLSNMTQQGYVKYGMFNDGLASTYYITESGKSFYKAQI